MKKIRLVLIILSLFYVWCKRNGTGENKEAEKADTTKFFQLTEYLKSQINEVNKTPFFIYKIDIVNGKKDSTAINTDVFNQLSKQFLTPDINDKNLKPHYTENIFEDQTTKGFTISYTAKDKQLEIQNVDILLSEDGQTVKRIFIRKFLNYPDSSAIEQLSWKPGESFQIIRSVQKPGNSEESRQTAVVWNPKS
jgi:hypothetical protein